MRNWSVLVVIAFVTNMFAALTMEQTFWNDKTILDFADVLMDLLLIIFVNLLPVLTV